MVSRKLAVAVVLIVLVAVLFPIFEGKLYTVAITWSLQFLAGRTPTQFSEDDLHVVFCGTGGPLLDANRAGPCTAIIAGGEIIIVDAGPGSWETIARLGLDVQKISSVFLTHLHSDHIGELGELFTMSWTMGRKKPLNVYGPNGTEIIVQGYDSIYQFDITYRIAHHGEDYLNHEGRKTIGHNIFTDRVTKDFSFEFTSGLVVTAFDVNHEPVIPAFGYRFDYKGASVVISGDTAYSENLIKHSQNVDIIIHDMLNDAILKLLIPVLSSSGKPSTAKIMTDVLEYHASIEDTLNIANRTNTRVLVCSHLLFMQNWFIERWLYLNFFKNWEGKSDVIFAHDGLTIKIDTKSREISSEKLSMFP